LSGGRGNVHIRGRKKTSVTIKVVSMQKKSPSKGSASALKTQRAKRDRERSSPLPQTASKVRILTGKKLLEVPWLLHGFSTRLGGVSKEYGGQQLNLGFTAEDTAENVERNRERFMRGLKARGVSTPLKPKEGLNGPLAGLPRLTLVKQVHSAAIHRIYGARGPEWARLRKGKVVESAGDGLITDTPGVLLGVKTADCYPVIVADRKRKAVGVFHAGWRGTVQRIVEKGIGEMRRQLGCNPEDLLAVIGPGIGACCYEIGEEVENEFDSQFAYSKELFEDVFDSWSLKTKYPMLFLNQRAPGHGEAAMSRHLDLVKANWCQLLDAGVPAENIESIDLCTACRTDLFFSYRKEHVTGRMLAVVGIR
jgi:YfiH family protein